MTTSSRNRTIRRPAMVIVAAACLWSTAVSAETIESALVRAYQNNPQLNAQRAAARAVDETVPQALSGYRPKVAVTASGGEQYSDTTSKTVTSIPGQPTIATYGRQPSTQTPYSVGATATQTLFDGFQTPNRTRAAESQVAAAREALRVMEQSVLLAAATSYMDVRRDMENLEVQRDNVRMLEETLRQTRIRLKASDVTATDVAQAEAQLAAGRSALLGAEATLSISKATYRQVVGVEPVDLAPASPVDRISPSALPDAIAQAVLENPSILAAMHGVDVSYLQVKINEGALFPTLALQANVQHANSPQFGVVQQTSAAVLGQVTVPIYQGGAEYSLIRQSKETLAQQRLNLDVVRSQVRQNVVQAWSQLEAAKAQLDAAHAQVAAANAALDGIRQEARVGQRTTFDVLNAQQVVVNARVAQLVAEHDRIVASYSLLSAIGRLSPTALGLPTPTYDPTLHYRQVRDAWFGVRAPSGQAFAASARQPEPNRQAAAEDSRAAAPGAASPAPVRTAAQAKPSPAKPSKPLQLIQAASNAPRPATTSPGVRPKMAAGTLKVPPAPQPGSASKSGSRPRPAEQTPQLAAGAPPVPATDAAEPPRTRMAVSNQGTPDRFSTENNSGLLSVGNDSSLFSGANSSGVLSGVDPVVPSGGSSGQWLSLR
jgi:outer membrane protein